MSTDSEEFDPNVPLDQYKFDDPNEELFFAIAWCENPGATGDFLAQMERAHSSGANLNSFSKDGNSPLTEAILGGMGSPKAVSRLLKLGADPSLRDQNGWMPWTACLSRIDDRVVEKRMNKIKEILLAINADRSDENILELKNAVCEKNSEKVLELLNQGVDVNASIVFPLEIAVRQQDIEMVELLIEKGANVEGSTADQESETPLIIAATSGNFELVKLLVEKGADVTKYAWGDQECTADFLAEEEGHKEIAAWLVKQLSDQAISKRKQKLNDMNPKFKEVHEKRTNGINCDITNDDVIKKLSKWDDIYKISISNVEHDGLTVQFENLPDNLVPLANEIYEFCPDIIEQGYGCMDDMVDMAEEYGHEIPAETLKLIEGIDFSDEDFGLRILQRELKAKKAMGFWWD